MGSLQKAHFLFGLVEINGANGAGALANKLDFTPRSDILTFSAPHCKHSIMRHANQSSAGRNGILQKKTKKNHAAVRMHTYTQKGKGHNFNGSAPRGNRLFG